MFSAISSEPLLGREREIAVIRSMVAGAQSGRSGVLVVTGDAGVGKTALVSYVGSSTQGMNFVQLVGLEGESGLPFAAVQRLVLHNRGAVSQLALSQQTALFIACGLEDGPSPTLVAVGLATLGLLTALAAEQPLLVWVEDAHWLDAESLSVLGFAGRRLYSEPVALVLTFRNGENDLAMLSGFPVLEVEGLSGEHAQALLQSVVSGPLDRRLTEHIIQSTAGNPLAIIDLSREMSTQQIVGGSLLHRPIPVGDRLESHYFQQSANLPPDTQMWLLLAATEATGDLLYVSQAADRLRLDASASRAAEMARLIDVGDAVQFRHPLVRSAIYNRSTSTDRRRAHQALADVTNRKKDTDRRAWHLASAALGPDEKVASLIVDVADRAGKRGGFASRASFLARAAELTEEGSLRTARLLSAAEAAVAAGSIAQAQSLLEGIGTLDGNSSHRGRALVVDAQLTAFSGVPGAFARVPAILFSAYQSLAQSDPVLARDALVRALEQAVIVESMIVDITPDTLAAQALSETSPDVSDLEGLVLRALGMQFAGPYSEAVGPARALVDALTSDKASDNDVLRWGMTGVVAATFLWDDAARNMILERAARVARQSGALQALDSILWTTALCETMLGHVDAAESAMAEGRELRIAVGATPEQLEVYTNAELLALHGLDDQLRQYAPRAIEAAKTLGVGAGPPVARSALMTLEISRNNYVTALVLAERIVSDDVLNVTIRVLPDLIESACRSGRPAKARECLARFSFLAEATATPWALGLLARCRALVEPEDAEALFHLSIDLLGTTSATLDLARSHLLYGEWLRRNRRRQNARSQLRSAIALFNELGAHAFGDRARAELLLTGEHARKRSVEDKNDLTSQELFIAQLAKVGATNAEIASRLFVSPNTVDYHLRKIYRKLGVTSRRDLGDALAAGAPGSSSLR